MLIFFLIFVQWFGFECTKIIYKNQDLASQNQHFFLGKSNFVLENVN